MKARIPTEPRCALVWQYGPDAPGYAALEQAARAFRLRLRTVTEADLAARVGDLCQGLPSPAHTMPVLLSPAPALIVSGLRHDNGDLGAFLDAVKRGGASIPLRAMVTPTSRSWTLLELLQELRREHDAVGGAE